MGQDHILNGQEWADLGGGAFAKAADSLDVAFSHAASPELTTELAEMAVGDVGALRMLLRLTLKSFEQPGMFLPERWTMQSN